MTSSRPVRDVKFNLGEGELDLESNLEFLLEYQSDIAQVSSVTDFTDLLEKSSSKENKVVSEKGAKNLDFGAKNNGNPDLAPGVEILPNPLVAKAKRSQSNASSRSVRFDVGCPDSEEHNSSAEQLPLLSEKSRNSKKIQVVAPIQDSHTENSKNHFSPPDMLRQTSMEPDDRKQHAEPHKMYIELYDLTFGEGGETEWQETARWMKYEEDAEGMDHHWGRPHVAFLSFHALLQLRKCVAKGVVSLDLEAQTFDEVVGHIAEEMGKEFEMDEERISAILSSLHKKHKHVHEAHSMHMPKIPTLARISSAARVSNADRDRKMSIIEEAYSQEASRAPSIMNIDENGFKSSKISKVQTGLTIEEDDEDQKPEKIPVPNGQSDNDKRRSSTTGGMINSASHPAELVRQLSFFKRPRQDSTSSITRRPRSFRGSKTETKLNFMGSKTPSFLTLSKEESDAAEILRHVPDDAETAQVKPVPWWRRKKSKAGNLEKPSGDASCHRKTTTALDNLYSVREKATVVSTDPAYLRTKTAPGSLNDRILSRGAHLDKEAQIILRKLAEGTENVQVFVGVLKELKGARFAMVRLADAIEMPELLEAPIPIRFLFVILGPNLIDIDYHELGRSISTLMSNPHFHEIAYRAESREELISAIDEFLDESIVVPPGEIDNRQLLAPEQIKKALRKRKRKRTEALEKMNQEQEKFDHPGKPGTFSSKSEKEHPVPSEKQYNPLDRTAKPFGGVIRDIKRRLPHYVTDYTDALNFQCLTSVIFMFFAAFAPAITFGGLMGNYTRDAMGITETLMAQCICGVIWGLFSAQPMLIMSATGPVLIFEASLFAFCNSLNLDFLVVRVWAGVWLAILALVTVMLEGSFLVSYVTRFTEDIFAVLISVIFISESIKFLQKTFYSNPVMSIKWYMEQRLTCFKENEPGKFEAKRDYLLSLVDVNTTSSTTSTSASITSINATSDASSALTTLVDGVFQLLSNVNSTTTSNSTTSIASSAEAASIWDYLTDEKPHQGCDNESQPDTGLLTAILLLATFALSYYLKKLRTSYYLGRTLRRAIGDFGVLIAIVIVTMIDFFLFNKPFLRRIDMPTTFAFTNSTARGGNDTIFISFDLKDKWAEGIFFALVPALLVYILLFVETEITQLLLAKKERGLRKGSGFHWDLVLMGLLALLCSILGLPWMCAAAVQSLAHASSLTVMKRHAPGERPSVDYVIEQRVTTIGVALLIGACAFAGKFITVLPLCVLFGVFLYLGVMNLVGVQFLNRIVLLFIPEKYFPDAAYCQKVRMWRMHLYTFMQIFALFVVYIVKHFKAVSLAFPFVLMFTAVLRILILPKVFTERELNALDAHEEEDDRCFDETDLYEEAHGIGM